MGKRIGLIIFLFIAISGCAKSNEEGPDVKDTITQEEQKITINSQETEDDTADVSIPTDTGDYRVFQTPEELIEASDLIIEGKIISNTLEDFSSAALEKEKRTTTVQIQNIYKGIYDNDTIDIITIKLDIGAEEPLKEGISYLFAIREKEGEWGLSGVISQAVYIVNKPKEGIYGLSAEEIISVCEETGD